MEPKAYKDGQKVKVTVLGNTPTSKLLAEEAHERTQTGGRTPRGLPGGGGPQRARGTRARSGVWLGAVRSRSSGQRVGRKPCWAGLEVKTWAGCSSLASKGSV